jgi:5-methylthioadenosine/S-adenosylhomocysteine deaminase
LSIMNDVFIRNARFVLTPEDTHRYIVYENIDINIEEGIVTCIGKCSKPHGSILIDGRNKLVTPAYINGHTHAGMSFLKGSLPDHEFWEWLEKIWNIEKKIVSPELVYHSSRISCLEMLMNGFIGFVDMYFYPEETIRACQDYGLYILTGPLSTHRDNIEKFIRKYQNAERVKPIVNLHSLYSLSREELFEGFNIAKEYGLKIHIHISETRREVYHIWKKTGKWPIEYLYSENLLSNNVILVHLNWITSMELELIAEKKASMIICPHSTMRLATGGFTPVYEAMRKNIPLTMGTDGVSGDHYDPLTTIRELILLSRHNYWDTRMRIEKVYPYIVVNGYNISGIRGGIIRNGMPGHIIVYDIDTIRNTPLRKSNLLSRYILGYGFTPRYVLINGVIAFDHELIEKYVREINNSIEYLDRVSEKIDYYEGRIFE